MRTQIFYASPNIWFVKQGKQWAHCREENHIDAFDLKFEKKITFERLWSRWWIILKKSAEELGWEQINLAWDSNQSVADISLSASIKDGKIYDWLKYCF